MNKVLLISLSLCVTAAIADSYSDALQARANAISALNRFNPAATINDYTATPQESWMKPTLNNNNLPISGLNALHNNPAGLDVYQKSQSREKVRANSENPELRYAEKLLENPEEVLNGACYKVQAGCQSKSVIKTCIDTVHYQALSCNEALNVKVNRNTQEFKRVFNVSPFTTEITFDLTSCAKNEWQCRTTNLVRLTKPCEGLSVRVSRFNKNLKITKKPSCDEPTLTVKIDASLERFAFLEINLTEYHTEDLWSQADCQRIQTQISHESCRLEKGIDCLNPNAEKSIDGLKVKRACWGRRFSYQCAKLSDTTCAALIKKGCSQTASHCNHPKQNECTEFSQAFQCLQTFCEPEKTVCPKKMACTDGQCDLSKDEASDDIQEGLSRLGALAGAATDVSNNQIKNGVPAIFTGKSQECKKFPIGVRDCCTDAGWGEWVKHCPEDLQQLKRARKDKRVVFLGSYKHNQLGSRHYAYCVFPTKLAAIIQIQGRGNQLGVSFGNAKHPDCRGITPEELERINFAALDLSPVEQELVARMALPANGSIEANNTAAIERMKEEGRAHD